MKRISIVLGLVAMVLTSVNAQPRINFGYVSDEEAKMTDCAFDSGAVAVILADEGFSDYTDDHGLMTYQHTKIKVLKEEGIKYANVTIGYYSENDAEFIDEISAMVINFDGKGGRKDLLVDKKSIYRKKINKSRSEVSFALPDVRVGSVLEYTYRLNSKHYGYLRDWDFQSDIPVYKSSYDLKIVPTREISYLVQYNPKFQIKVEPNKLTKSVYFEMKNLPALTNEPYMDSRRDFVQKVIFQTTQYANNYGSSKFMVDWNGVTKELLSREDFGRQIKINIDECNAFIKSTVEGKSDYEKMKLIHKFVIDNTEWNGYDGVVTADGIRSLWKNKSGSAAEINLLLVNMLQNAGLEVYPMLVSERGHGKINKTTPFIKQFNNVYAAVSVDGKRYFLDATDKFTPCYITPFSILNTSAFIANNKNGGLVDIQEDKIRYRDILAIDGNIDNEGQYTGSVVLISRDYARAYHLRQIKETKKDEYVNKAILSGLSNVAVTNFKSQNEDNDTLPLQQNFDFKTQIQNTGDYAFLSLNMFTGFENNPFVINNRFSPVNFGYTKYLNQNCVIHLPENLRIDEIPKNIKMLNADGSVVFTREIFNDVKNHQLVARYKVEINKSVFGVEQYPELKEFYKKMVDFMNEQIVLKKI